MVWMVEIILVLQYLAIQTRLQVELETLRRLIGYFDTIL